MFKIVIVPLGEQATCNSKFIAMRICNRGWTHQVAVGRSEREARNLLCSALRENKTAKFN